MACSSRLARCSRWARCRQGVHEPSSSSSRRISEALGGSRLQLPPLEVRLELLRDGLVRLVESPCECHLPVPVAECARQHLLDRRRARAWGTRRQVGRSTCALSRDQLDLGSISARSRLDLGSISPSTLCESGSRARRRRAAHACSRYAETRGRHARPTCRGEHCSRRMNGRDAAGETSPRAERDQPRSRANLVRNSGESRRISRTSSSGKQKGGKPRWSPNEARNWPAATQSADERTCRDGCWTGHGQTWTCPGRVAPVKDGPR